MKLEHLLFLMGFHFINISFTQETNNYFVTESDNNFLRDYKAPDFKFRSLTLVFDANGQGSTTELNNNQNLRSSTAFGFSQNFNTIKSQRTTSAIFHGNFNLNAYRKVYQH